MRLPKEERAIVNVAIDDVLDTSEGDIVRAANYLADELHGMEGSGAPWVGELLDSLLLVGVKQMIRQRIRSKRLAVGSASMPAYYTVGLASAQWMHVDIDDLEPIIERLTKSARSYTEHAAVLIDSQRHAIEHDVRTAAEGFAAAGVEITELAS